MKLLANRIELNAKTKLSLALCTVLALSGACLMAADDKDTGAPGSASTKEAGKTSHLSRGDEKFIKDAAKGGMMEVQMGKLAVQKAQSAQVKQYGQRLIDDHTKANTELKQIAATKGVTLPESHEGITSDTDTTDRTQVREKSDSDHDLGFWDRRAMKKLEGLSGTEFDREFIKMAVSDHQKDVKEFEKASKDLDDSDLKAFAAKVLPKLQEHLSQAQTLEASIGSTGAPGSSSGIDSDKSGSNSK